MTKSSIVSRLLEDKIITAEEAVVLLKETSIAVNGFQDLSSKPIRSYGKVPYWQVCGCTTCGCTLANTFVDPDMGSSFSGEITIDNL